VRRIFKEIHKTDKNISP